MPSRHLGRVGIVRPGGPCAGTGAAWTGLGNHGEVTSIGPVSAVDALRAQRKQAPFRPLPDPPPMLTRVTFIERDLHAHQTPPLQFPAPRPISVQEQVDMTRPVTNTTALLAAALAASLPQPVVTTRSYLQAQLRAFT